MGPSSPAVLLVAGRCRWVPGWPCQLAASMALRQQVTSLRSCTTKSSSCRSTVDGASLQFIDSVVDIAVMLQRQVRTVSNCAFLDWLLTCPSLCTVVDNPDMAQRPFLSVQCRPLRFPSCSPLIRCSMSLLRWFSRFSGVRNWSRPHSCTRRILAWTMSFTCPLCATADAWTVQTPLQYV